MKNMDEDGLLDVAGGGLQLGERELRLRLRLRDLTAGAGAAVADAVVPAVAVAVTIAVVAGGKRMVIGGSRRFPYFSCKVLL